MQLIVKRRVEQRLDDRKVLNRHMTGSCQYLSMGSLESRLSSSAHPERNLEQMRQNILSTHTG